MNAGRTRHATDLQHIHGTTTTTTTATTTTTTTTATAAAATTTTTSTVANAADAGHIPACFTTSDSM